MSDNDTSYAYSESSSIEDHPFKSLSRKQNINGRGFSKYKYKWSTRNRRFGKTKKRYEKKLSNVHLNEIQPSSKIFPSLKRVRAEPVSMNPSQIFHIQHFQEILNNAHVCLEGGRLKFIPDALPPVGLFHYNVFRCTKCEKETPMTNYPVIKPMESEQQEPNKRLTIAAATTGLSYKATKGLTSTLGLTITTEKTFLQQLHKHYDLLHIYANKNLQTIIKDLKLTNNKEDEIMKITVSLDGTWKRRGHVSNFGIVFIIDAESGKCIDYEVLSLFCGVCNMKKSKLTDKQFSKWFKKHKPFCHKNYDGTSKSMEKEGTIRLFKRSMINGLQYKTMVCDGDASAYEAVKHHYIERQQMQLGTKYMNRSNNKHKVTSGHGDDTHDTNSDDEEEEEEEEDGIEDTNSDEE
ncbi:unnamed protein product, partial [Rotaria magnacalcarata]